jgi:cysteine desulfurase
MAVALESAVKADVVGWRRRRDVFIAAVEEAVPAARLTGHRTQRLPGHASFVIPGRSGESLLLDLQQQGVVCSSGSACAAGSSAPSPVLLALGISGDEAHSAVRFTFGDHLPEHALKQTVKALRQAAR